MSSYQDRKREQDRDRQRRRRAREQRLEMVAPVIASEAHRHALIEAGYLAVDAQEDRDKVARAIECVLDALMIEDDHRYGYRGRRPPGG